MITRTIMPLSKVIVWQFTCVGMGQAGSKEGQALPWPVQAEEWIHSNFIH